MATLIFCILFFVFSFSGLSLIFWSHVWIVSAAAFFIQRVIVGLNFYFRACILQFIMPYSILELRKGNALVHWCVDVYDCSHSMMEP